MNERGHSLLGATALGAVLLGAATLGTAAHAATPLQRTAAGLADAAAMSGTTTRAIAATATALLNVLWPGAPTALFHSSTLTAAAPAADTAGAAPATTATPGTTATPSPGSAPTTPDTAAPAPPNAATAMPTEDIRDIRGPKFIVPAWLIPAVVAGAALLAFLAYRLWRWRQQRRRPRALLPFEAALQQLEDIRPLMQPASAREFSIAVSDIVRGYIEVRFDVTATHRTTEEFLHDLLQTTKPSLARHRGLLAEFLQQCDLVKFGGMSLSLQSMESLHHSARVFVLETAKPDVVEPQDRNKDKEAHDPLPTT